MPNESATVLEFASILGEAIARAHLAGKQIEKASQETNPRKQNNRVARIKHQGELLEIPK